MDRLKTMVIPRSRGDIEKVPDSRWRIFRELNLWNGKSGVRKQY